MWSVTPSKMAKAQFSKVQYQQNIVYYFLSLLSGLYAFLVIIAIFLPDGIIEREELYIYILGWPASCAAAVLSLMLLRNIQERYFRDNDQPLWVLLAFNSTFFAFLTTILHLAGALGKSNAVYIIVNSAIVFIPLANAALYWWMVRSPFKLTVDVLQNVFLLGCLGIINFFVLLPDPLKYHTPPIFLLTALLCGAILSFLKIPHLKIRPNKLISTGLDIFIILMIFLICFDPLFAIEPTSQNFYLGSANRIIHGGTMLVDAFSQYGVLVIYFISIIFTTGIIPFTYQGFSLFATLIFILHFIMLYFLLKELFENHLYAIFLLCIIIILGFFGTLYPIQAFPSTGPLRFGLPYLTLCAIYVNRRYFPVHRYAMLMEYLLIGIASLWSFETFIFTAVTYFGVCFYEIIFQSDGIKQFAKIYFRRVLWLFLTLAVFQTIFIFFTIIRSGVLPNYGIYLETITTYSSMGGFGTILIYPWGYWFVLICIYLASLVAFFFRFFIQKDLENSPQNILIFGLTLFGILSFTYFVGRSYPNNLYHISTPAVIIAGYGFSRFSKSDFFSNKFRNATKFVFYSAVILIILFQTPILLAKLFPTFYDYYLTLKNNSSFLETEHSRLNQGSGEQQVAEALTLMEKYTPGKKEATVFLSSMGSTEVLMLAGRTHLFPINDVNSDALSKTIFWKIVNYPQMLKVNDFIFLMNDPLFYAQDINDNILQIYMIDRFCKEFLFKVVETSPSGVNAVQLLPYSDTPTPYCDIIKSIKNKDLQ